MLVTCPKCRKPMIRGLFQRHQLASVEHLICINATQFRCTKCSTSRENKTGGMHLSHDARNTCIGKYTLYITPCNDVDLVSAHICGIDGTDYLFKGDLA